ncbi:putative holin-like toxin [Paenibacillus sp. VCA1]|uniref:putative holin-like toxin n=1 Tax=Paenibacillus sp. VCA1 TaxID=3039148 RepID=UPI0037C5CBFF
MYITSDNQGENTRSEDALSLMFKVGMFILTLLTYIKKEIDRPGRITVYFRPILHGRLLFTQLLYMESCSPHGTPYLFLPPYSSFYNAFIGYVLDVLFRFILQ